MIFRYCLILLLIIPCFAFQYTLHTDSEVEHRYIIQLKSNKSKTLEVKLANHLEIESQKIKSRSIFPSLSIYSLVLTTSSSIRQIEISLSKQSEILFFHKDQKVKNRSTIPNDVDFSEQWNLDLIGAPDAWDKTSGGTTASGHEIVVAIIDNGYDVAHEDLSENLWVNKSEIPDNEIDDDNNGYIDDYLGVNTREGNGNIPSRTHGTGVAGIIGARGNNTLGISGINWDVKMMLITGAGLISDIIESYNYALTYRKLFNETDGREGAFVVATNFSSGLSEAFAEDYPIWCSIYDALGDEGILNVAAAPNQNVDIDIVGDMPANCPSDFLVIVNNIDRSENLASDSGIGETEVDIAAPGDEAFSLSIRNTYNEFSGTSSSTPHVAGAIALMYSIDKAALSRQYLSDPKGTAADVKRILYSTAKKLNTLSGTNATGGRLDLRKAVEEMDALYDSASSNPLTLSNNLLTPGSNLIVQYLVDELVPHEINIYDATGRWASTQSFTPRELNLIKIEVPINQNFQAGTYFIQVKGEKKKAADSFIVY